MRVTDSMIDKACKANIHPDSEPSDTERRKMRAALEAALSAAEPQPAPSVSVKALEWEFIGKRNPPSSSIYSAETPFLSYMVSEREDGSGCSLYSICGNLPASLPRTLHSKLEEAKAAAQADYEARIRSALA